MKTTKSLQIVALSIIGLGLPVTGHCQIYTLSTPVSGYLTMSVYDFYGDSIYSGGRVGGGFYYNFNTLTETVYLDLAAQTIRQVGVISGTPLQATGISWQETQMGGFYLGQDQQVTGDVTVTLTPPAGGLSFDTGPKHFTWNAASGTYTFDGRVLSNIANLGGSYSLVTGGQTFSDLFTYGLSFYDGQPNTFSEVSIGNANSLTLSGLGNWDTLGEPCLYINFPRDQGYAAATNGFYMVLKVGEAVSDNQLGELFLWNSPGMITAVEVVPEPASLSLLAFSVFGITHLRRHQR